MKIDDFKLERYFAKHEFTAKYLLSSSDCDGYEQSYVLQQASEKERALWEGLKLGYTESEGSTLLRKAILQFYNLESVENVVVASPGELNFITMNVLLNSGDHVVSVSPAYQSLYEVVKSLGCEISWWKPNPENWEFKTEDLKDLIQDNTKLLILNFPHNPTGSYLSRQQLDEIIALARKNDVTIFSDEMYRKLTVSGMEELPAVCDIYEKGISLWGMAKSFGLAGVRIGWLVSQDIDFLERVIAFKDYLSICSSAPSEILSMIALNHSDAFILSNIQKIKRNIATFQDFASNQDLIISFIPPKAGSTAFVELNVAGSSLEFSDQLVKDTGIMTVPAEMFEQEGKFIRVGFGRENFPVVLELLDKYLRDYKS